MSIWTEIDGVLYLPDAASDEIDLIAAAERTTPMELLRRRVDLTHDSAALRKEMRRLSRLLAERVSRPGGEWLDATEVAQRLRMSVRSVYVELERHPTGLLAQAATRIGRRLRFNREGIDAALRSGLNRRAGRVSIKASRVPSLRKETGL